MSEPHARPSAAAAPDVAPTRATPDGDAPDREWIVGERTRAEGSGADGDVRAGAAARRRARLEARLAVYARYASVVADETAAALDGSGDRVRTLAAQRQSLEEQWRELHEMRDDDATAALPFDQALAGALHELDAQSAVELALRRRLAELTGDGAHAPRLLAAGEPALPLALDDSTRGALLAEAALADADAAARAEALGEAVAGTLGGSLARAYPAVVARTDPAAYGRVEARPPAPPAARVDVRF